VAAAIPATSTSQPRPGGSARPRRGRSCSDPDLGRRVPPSPRPGLPRRRLRPGVPPSAVLPRLDLGRSRRASRRPGLPRLDFAGPAATSATHLPPSARPRARWQPLRPPSALLLAARRWLPSHSSFPCTSPPVPPTPDNSRSRPPCDRALGRGRLPTGQPCAKERAVPAGFSLRRGRVPAAEGGHGRELA
jgi:hypothetical protein